MDNKCIFKKKVASNATELDIDHVKKKNRFKRSGNMMPHKK